VEKRRRFTSTTARGKGMAINFRVKIEEEGTTLHGYGAPNGRATENEPEKWKTVFMSQRDGGGGGGGKEPDDALTFG